MLLDYELKKSRYRPGIDPTGYEREVTTHIAVALAVKSGRQRGRSLRVPGATKALNLPFVPVASEPAGDWPYGGRMQRTRVLWPSSKQSVLEFKIILERLGRLRYKEAGTITAGQPMIPDRAIRPVAGDYWRIGPSIADISADIS